MTDQNRFDALSGSMKDFRHLPGSDLLSRVESFYQWQEARRAVGVWPLGRSTEQGAFSRCTARTDEGQLFAGVKFHVFEFSTSPVPTAESRRYFRADSMPSYSRVKATRT